MTRNYRLPLQELPESWADMVQWTRTRDGWRERLQTAARQYFDAGEDSYERLWVAAGGRDALDVDLPTFDRQLLSYFEGTVDLPLHLLADLIRVTGARPRVLPIAPFDLFRRRWIGPEQGPAPPESNIGSFGFTLNRLQSCTFDRVLNGALRRWDDPATFAGLEDSLHVSRGAGFVVVLEGTLDLEYLAPGMRRTVRLRANQAIGYRMSWPHVFRPVGDEPVRCIDLCASKRGVPPEYDVREYSSPLIESFPAAERVGEDSALHTLSHALACYDPKVIGPLFDFWKEGTTSSVTHRDQAVVNRIRGQNTAEKESRITLHDVIEAAHVLRIPEEHFFTPLARHLETAVEGARLDGDGRVEPFDLLQPAPTGDPVRSWFLASPPSEIVNRRSGLEVHLLEVDEYVEFGDEPMQRRDDIAGERMIVVLEGELDVRICGGRPDPERNPCEGTLNPGDSLWLRADQLAHAFWNPRPTRARALDVRYRYSEGRELTWGVPM
ncbi:MAG: hypothetical protein AAFP86_02665 [Planctomycetota bacterium]